MATAGAKGAEALRGEIKGEIVLDGDAAWDEARQAYNLAVDQRPEMVALPADADDVARVVDFARESGLRVAPQRTGHNADPIGPQAGYILLNTKGIRGVEIDADNLRARVSAGDQWQDLVPKISELGLTALHGSAPDIGIPGYMLGGGIGFYARKLGMACNSILAIELVNADGERIRVDAENEPELFWAMRGGGGNFGIATALEFRLFPMKEIYAGVLFFDFERSSEILHAWREWCEGSPEEVTSVGRIMQFPPMPEVPEPLRGNSFSLVEAVFQGSEEDGIELMKPLRDLGPSIDTFAMVPPVGIAELHMDPPDPLPYEGHHTLVKELSPRMIDDFVGAAGPGSGSTLISAEIRQFGGELARRKPDSGAMAAVDSPFFYFGVGIAADAESAKATSDALRGLETALEPYNPGVYYYNFVEQPADAATCFDPETYERLRRARSRYDPNRVFRANHEIALAG